MICLYESCCGLIHMILVRSFQRNRFIVYKSMLVHRNLCLTQFKTESRCVLIKFSYFVLHHFKPMIIESKCLFFL